MTFRTLYFKADYYNKYVFSISFFMPMFSRPSFIRNIQAVPFIAGISILVPLVAFAAATIPAGCSTPGDCDELTPTFLNLAVQEGVTASGALAVEGGANIDGTTFAVDASNNRVGIGTASPTTHLDINAAADTILRVSSTTNAADARLLLNRNAQGNARSVIQLLTGGVADWYIGTFNFGGGNTSGSDLHISSTGQGSANPQFTFTKTGRVGIATAAPDTALDVVGTMSGTVVNVSSFLSISPRATAPSTPSAGDVYFDSTTGELCLWDGSSWTGLKAGGACA